MGVAPSFQSFEFLSEVFEENSKQYITVKNPKTGTIRKVRWYAEKEASKSVNTGGVVLKPKFDAKKALGFEKGYITIFKGNTYAYKDWFGASIARYHNTWGWYIVSTDEVPADLPPGVTPIQLNWEDVSDEGNLMPQTAIQEIVDSLVYEPSPSKHIGSIGERIDIDVVITNRIESDGYYGQSFFYIMEDSDHNVYTWNTGAKTWSIGETHKLRGTVKAHNIYKNTKQTQLTRCSERS